MKNRTITTTLLAVCAALGASASLRAGTILSLSPSSSTVGIGGTTVVEIDLSGLGNNASPAVAGYTGLLLAFDPTILSPATILFSNRLGDPSDPLQTFEASNTFLNGSVQLDAVSFLSSTALFGLQSRPAGAPVNLATVTFTGIASGTSLLTLSYGAFSDENGNALSPTTQNASITVGRTPEPVSFFLLPSGLAALLVIRKRYARPRG